MIRCHNVLCSDRRRLVVREVPDSEYYIYQVVCQVCGSTGPMCRNTYPKVARQAALKQYADME